MEERSGFSIFSEYLSYHLGKLVSVFQTKLFAAFSGCCSIASVPRKKARQTRCRDLSPNPRWEHSQGLGECRTRKLLAFSTAVPPTIKEIKLGLIGDLSLRHCEYFRYPFARNVSFRSLHSRIIVIMTKLFVLKLIIREYGYVSIYMEYNRR